MEREFLKTLKNKIVEIGKEEQPLIVLYKFDFEVLSMLAESINEYAFFKDDILDPPINMEKIAALDFVEFGQYLVPLLNRGTQPFIMTSWLYKYLHTAAKKLLDGITQIVVIENNSDLFRSHETDELDNTYNIEDLQESSFKRIKLLPKLDFQTCFSSSQLLELLQDKKIYSIKTSQELQKALQVNAIQFTKKPELSDVQLFDSYDETVEKRLSKYHFFEKVEKWNPILFTGYFPSLEVQQMDLEEYLRKGFGYTSFKTYKKLSKHSRERDTISQKGMIQFVLDQYLNEVKDTRDLFFVSGTGSGKSLIYQLSAYIMRAKFKTTTIVITPLIALMKDQTDNLEKSNLNAEYDNSGLTYNQHEEVMNKIKANSVDILYISPEKFVQNSNFYLNNMDIGLMVIDEAHLVSTWGKTFRVDYGYLGEIIRRINKERKFPIIATTATCVWGGRFDSVEEIKQLLHLKDPYVVMTEIKRENIELTIHTFKEEVDRFNTTISEIKKYVDDKKKAIVYCAFVSAADDIVMEFKTLYGRKAHRIGCYTGRMKSGKKESNQNLFKNNHIDVMVATKAFGMGIDVDNIERVLHHDIPCNLAEYIQEVGRAGRNQNINAEAICFYDKKTIQNAIYLSKFSIPARWVLKKIFEHIADKVRRVTDPKIPFTVSLEDMMYVFDRMNNKDEAMAKTKVVIFLVQKDLERQFKRPVLYKTKETYKYLYFRTTPENGEMLMSKYNDLIREMPDSKYITHTLTYGKKKVHHNYLLYEIDITGLWQKKMKAFSLAQLVRSFFYKPTELFDVDIITPHILAEIDLNKKSPESVRRGFGRLLSFLKDFCLKYWNKVSKPEFMKEIKQAFSDDGVFSKKERELYEVFTTQFGVHYGNIQRKELYHTSKILKLSRYEKEDKIERINKLAKITDWETKLDDMLNISQKHDQIYFFPADSKKNELEKNILNILDALDLAKVKYEGGNSPVITLQCADKGARNFILNNINSYNPKISTQIRNQVDSNIDVASYFYRTPMTSEQRWEFLERFFLGEDVLE